MQPSKLLLLLLLPLSIVLTLFFDFSALQAPKSEQKKSVDYIWQAARLDDPVGTKQAWLQDVHGRHNSSSVLGGEAMQQWHQQREIPDNLPAIICSDTCHKAHDGVCDEGRQGNLSNAAAAWVFCDLGTDCNDCGPWQGLQHGPAWSEGTGPVQYIRMHGHAGLQLQQVPYPPAFLFATAEPQRDPDISARMSSTGVIEPGMTQVFHAALAGRCNASTRGASPGLVLDVGAHLGWFSLLAAALGCRAVAIEPVPLFRAFLEYSAARNHLTHMIEVLPAVVAADATKVHTLSVPLSGQLGTAGLHAEVHQHSEMMQVPARAVRLDDLAFPANSSSPESTQAQPPQQQKQRQLQHGRAPASGSGGRTSKGVLNKGSSFSSSFLRGSSRIEVMKVDVEGHEPEVLATAQQLLASGRVHHILLEYSPGYYYTRLSEMPTLPAMLLDLLRYGYRLLHLPWHVVYDDAAVKAAGSWNVSSLPSELGLITRSQLTYDVWTAERLRNGTLPGMHGPSSWPCPEMAASGMSAAEPHLQHMALHVLFHPLSFASHFVFNTNIWASLQGQLQPQGKDLSTDRELFPAWYDPASEWFPQSAAALKDEQQQESGLPWAYCAHIPAAFQVAHRCLCRDWAVCGEHQVAVQACRQKRQTGYENLMDLPASCITSRAHPPARQQR